MVDWIQYDGGWYVDTGSPNLFEGISNSLTNVWDSYQNAWNNWTSQTSSNITGGAATGLIGAGILGYVIIKSGLIDKMIKAIK